jgi:hypothetical protein
MKSSYFPRRRFDRLVVEQALPPGKLPIKLLIKQVEAEGYARNKRHP